MLAKRWREHGDRDAAHKLVTSHLRLVAKIAMGYRGYGLPIAEVISEGNVGLMQAVKRFEPEKGFRLATYAMWWIKASIQEYILRSWSLVKMGTTANQKKLFFNLRKAKSKISALEEGDLRPDQVKHHRQAARRHRAGRGRHEPPARRRRVAQRADPRGRRLRRVAGLAGRRQREPGNACMADAARSSTTAARRWSTRSACSTTASGASSRRAGSPTIRSRSRSSPSEFGVSRERVRQIEVRAFEKVQKAVKNHVAAMETPPAAGRRNPRALRQRSYECETPPQGGVFVFHERAQRSLLSITAGAGIRARTKPQPRPSSRQTHRSCRRSCRPPASPGGCRARPRPGSD